MSDERVHFVILSVDARETDEPDPPYLKPPTVGEWEQTEGDEQYDFGYLADEFGDESYRNGVHRKWVGYLSESEFDAWLGTEGYDREDAREQGEPTMGSITFDGTFPAYCLSDDPAAWGDSRYGYPVICRDAYVTEYAYGNPPAEQLPALLKAYGMGEQS